MIKQDSKSWNKYLLVLRNRIYKILPLIEEDNEGVFKYVDSLVFELYGIRYVIEDLENSNLYITLLATLESILDELIIEERDFSFIRGRILDLTNSVEKMQKSEV